MNPFKNRWVAAICVLGVLLMVAELVGTGERSGVLSQMVRPSAPQDMSSSEERIEVYTDTAPTVIDEVPEDDLPQLVTEDDVVDDDFSGGGDEVEIAIDLPAEDEPVED